MQFEMQLCLAACMQCKILTLMERALPYFKNNIPIPVNGHSIVYSASWVPCCFYVLIKVPSHEENMI